MAILIKALGKALVFGAILAALIMANHYRQIGHWEHGALTYWATGAAVIAVPFLPFAYVAERRKRARESRQRQPRRTAGHPRNGRRASADGYVSSGR
jgi:hypothetical protein